MPDGVRGERSHTVATTSADSMTPYDFIESWKADDEGWVGVPSPDLLTETDRAFHAVAEFLVEPVRDALKHVSATSTAGEGRVAEDARAVTYEDIGRLIVFTDGLRKECAYLFETLAEIALLAHEDLREIAEGCVASPILEDRDWSRKMRRFHGLDRESAW